MKRVLVAGALLAGLVVAGPAQVDASGEAVIYLHPDSADRYRPAIDLGGSVSILANINSITPPAMSADGGWVAFSGALGNGSLANYAIYKVRTDGSGLTQLTTGSYGEFDPSWAPNGQSIVVAQNQGGSILPSNCCRLASVNATTGAITGLTVAIGVARPEYSSTGSYIVYDTPRGVYRISPSGGVPTLLAIGGYDATTSPSATRVAYIARGSTYNEIRTVSSSAGSASVVYQTAGQIEGLSWDGDRIFFLEHTGLGYDGRKNVTMRSIPSSGGPSQIHRSFSTHIVGLSPVADNDELFFYRDDGLFRFYQIRPDASLPSPMLAGSGYTTDWGSITSVDLDGDTQDEMFFYREDGLFRYYDVKTDGRIGSPLVAGDGYTTGWDSITSIDLEGDGQDEMFFYRQDGLYRYYDVRSNGSLPSPLRAGSDYSSGWDVIEALDADGDGQDEIVFYRSDGQFRLYDISASAHISSPIQTGDYGSGWASIAAVDLDGDGTDELFFYGPSGSFRYYDVLPNGALGGLIRGGTGYTTGWSTITSINTTPG